MASPNVPFQGAGAPEPATRPPPQQLSELEQMRQQIIFLTKQAEAHAKQKSMADSLVEALTALRGQAAAAAAPAAAAQGPAAIKLKIPPPSRFDGKIGLSVLRWIEELDKHFHYHSLSNTRMTTEQQMAYVRIHLGTDATHWLDSLSAAARAAATASWPAFKEALRARYCPVDADATARADLDRLSQRGRSVSAYTHRFLNIVSFLPDMHEKDKVHRFLAGLNPALAVRVSEQKPTTLESASALAVHLEASTTYYLGAGAGKRFMGATGRSFNSNSESTPMDLNHIGAEDSSSDDDSFDPSASSGRSLASRLESLEHSIRALHGSHGRPARRNPSRASNLVPGLKSADIERLIREGKCFLCKQPGHRKADCPSRGGGRTASAAPPAGVNAAHGSSN